MIGPAKFCTEHFGRVRIGCSECHIEELEKLVTDYRTEILGHAEKCVELERRLVAAKTAIHDVLVSDDDGSVIEGHSVSVKMCAECGQLVVGSAARTESPPADAGTEGD